MTDYFPVNPPPLHNVNNQNGLGSISMSMSYCAARTRAVRAMLLFGCAFLMSLLPATAGDARKSSLAADAMALLHNNCLSCHNAEKHKAGLQLTTRESLLKGGENGTVLEAGKPDKSLIVKVLAADADPHMPPKKQLSTSQMQLMRRWVAAGAPWDESALVKAAAPRSVTVGDLPASYRPALALALSPDDKRLAVARGSQIIVHDLTATNFPALAEHTAHYDAVRALAWSSDGKFLASGSFRELTLWDGEMKPVWSIATNLLDRINALAFAEDKLIACDGSAAQSGWVRIFSAETGVAVTNWQAHADTIYGMAVSPDAKTLATASADGLVKLWEIAAAKELFRIEAHVGAVFGVAFNSNATELVTVGADKQLKVWDLQTRQSFVTINGKKHTFNAVAWSADGKTVVAGADDGRLYSYTDFKRHSGAQSSDTGKERELGSWSEPLYAVRTTFDGGRAFAGDYDGHVYVVNNDRKLLAKISPPEMSPASDPSQPSFVRDVLPALARAGCMAGSCHAKAEGQNGFKLSVFSYDPAADYTEIVKEGRGRRIFPAAPEESLLLLKPTMTIDHGGGIRFERGSETYNLLVRWITSGMVYRHTDEPALVRIDVEPRERTYRKRASQPLKVTAQYADGSKRDVTRLADFVSNDKEFAQVDPTGVVRVGSLPGQSVIIARYMGFVDAAHMTVPADRTLPAKRYAKLPSHNFIDELAYKHFQRLGLFPSELCTDTEFLRRSSLDAIGVLPTIEETRAFLANTNANKRGEWIEHLLAHPAYGDYWANKWADLLRPNPDRVGVKSVYVLDQWLRESFRANKPYDQFARELLTAEGSNHRYGPAVVYRDRREPPELTTIFSQLFLGTRMECAKCHHHPNEKWSMDDYFQLAAFFGQLKRKGQGISAPISGEAEYVWFAPGCFTSPPGANQTYSASPEMGAEMPWPLRFICPK